MGKPGHVNNKGADQPEPRHRLTSTVDVQYVDSTIQ